MKQLYLIHSMDPRWVTRQREELVDQLVPREMRDECLREFFSTRGGALRLADIVGDLIGELSMIPFLPDSRRVAVVHNLGDFLAGGRSGRSRAARGKKKDEPSRKRTPEEIFQAFVENDLPATGNIAVFSLIIDSSQGHYLDRKNALLELFQKSSIAQVLTPPQRETDPLFQMSDALLERNGARCIAHFREVYNNDNAGRIFREVLRNVRFLLQANLLARFEQQGESRETIELKYLPDDGSQNFYKQNKFVQDKIRRAASRFKLRELMEAMERLLDVNRALYPSARDTFVPDVRLLLETFILDFCRSEATPR